MSRPAHIFVAGIALVAVFTLILQTAIDLGTGDSLGQTLWFQARYFTNLTVLVVALTYGTWALRARWPGPSLPGAVTVWIVLVGVVYHALLAATHNPEGWDILVNILQHTALPIAVLAAWAFTAPKTGLKLIHPVLWVAYPLGYAIYALVRGLMDGKFHYFFLNPDKTGWPGVIGYILGLGLAFLLAGLALYALARRMKEPS